MDCVITIFQDTRRPKGKDLYPLKLRVFLNKVKKVRYFGLNIFLSKQEFESIWQTERPRRAYIQQRIVIQKELTRALDIAEKLNPFSLDQFALRWNNNFGDKDNVFSLYDNQISRLKSANRIGTANNYIQSKASLSAFQSSQKADPALLPLTEITSNWLGMYEEYMLQQDKSPTTVGIYLRPLRAIFNTAIAEKEVDPEFYPFGKRRYQIPSSRKVKKALSNDELKKLFESKSEVGEQLMARDFWFFSYSCNGLNIKDIAHLRYENVHEDTITLYRAKTANTSKSDRKPILIYISDFARKVIEMYGNKNTDKKQFVFPILKRLDSPEECHRKVSNFTRFINQNIKKLAENNGVTKEISTYWARHSFATNAIRKGASMEFVSQALSHNNLKTTQSYFAGFEEEKKRDFMKELMNF